MGVFVGPIFRSISKSGYWVNMLKKMGTIHNYVLLQSKRDIHQEFNFCKGSSQYVTSCLFCT